MLGLGGGGGAITIGDVVLNIVGDSTQGEGAVNAFKDKTQRSLSELSTKIGAGMTAAGAAITGFFGVALKQSADAEQAQAQLNAVLESTGHAAGLTAEELNKMSAALSQTTTFEDDAITSAQSLMLTFTQIGKEVFPQATETILDMSTALDQDLKASSIQLGKALNDPIKGISALSEIGVSFTESQKEVVKALVETGDVAGAQRLILAELAKEFGGSAAAEAGTFAGQLMQLKNAFGDLMEAIGNALTGGGGMQGLITRIKEIVLSVTTWITEHPKLTEIIVKSVAAFGALMFVLGPFLMILPGLIALFGGGGLVGAIAPLVMGAGALVPTLTAGLIALGPAILVVGAALIVLAPLFVAVGREMGLLTEAQERLRQSDAAVEESTNRLIQSYRAKGVAINEAAMAEMTAAERIVAVNAAAIAHREQQTAYEIALLTGAQATKEQLHRGELARVAADLDAKGAAVVALSSLTDEQIKGLLSLTEAERAAALQRLGITQAAAERTAQTYTRLERHIDGTSLQMRSNLFRLSLDHRESPSVLDMAFQSMSVYASMWDSLLSSIAGKVESWWAWLRGVLSQAMGALGMAPGLPRIPGNAEGTPFWKGGPTMLAEAGAELVMSPTVRNLARGSAVLNAEQTTALLGGGGGKGDVYISVNLAEAHIREEADVERLSRDLYNRIRNAGHDRGVSVGGII